MECGEPMIWVDEVSVHVVQTRSGRNVLALGREEMGKLNVMWSREEAALSEVFLEAEGFRPRQKVCGQKWVLKQVERGNPSKVMSFILGARLVPCGMTWSASWHQIRVDASQRLADVKWRPDLWQTEHTQCITSSCTFRHTKYSGRSTWFHPCFGGYCYRFLPHSPPQELSAR